MLHFLLTLLCASLTTFSAFANEGQVKPKVGLCIMATGRYDVYAEELIQSARPYFCTKSDVTYFVFTDGHVAQAPDVVQIYQKRLGWPHDTLMRFYVYDLHREEMSKMDYLFALDADMRFVAPVGEEILSDLVGTQHPGYLTKRGTYEENPISRAYVARNEGGTYFAGGFYGGKRDEFFKLCQINDQRISADAANNFIAVWHDESHLNRYFIDHYPTKVLNPSYCYPENWNLPYPKRLIALDKNHAEMRKP